MLSLIHIFPKIIIDIAPDIIPIIIPSTIKGHLIKLFVAPTYFIIDISFLLACTVSFIVFDIINIEIIINIASITPVIILIPFAKLINVVTVSSLLVIFFITSSDSDFPSSYASIFLITSPLLVKSVKEMCIRDRFQIY